MLAGRVGDAILRPLILIMQRADPGDDQCTCVKTHFPRLS